MNWLVVIVGAVFFICMVVGYMRGFLKIIVSFAVTLGTIALVITVTPHVADAIMKYTPLDESIQKKCAKMLKPDLSEVDLTGTPLEGVDLEQSGMTLEEIEEELGKVEIPRQKQIELVEASELPAWFKKGLIANNNSEAYNVLNVKSFPEYVGAYLAKVVIKMLAFLVTFLLVTILVRAVIFALDVITALPVIKGLNKFAGMLVGMLIALMLVWIGFFVITLIYETALGKECFQWIAESELLTYLYNQNIILKFMTKLG